MTQSRAHTTAPTALLTPWVARLCGLWQCLTLAVLCALALSGCASMRAIDSQVRSFAGPAGAIAAGAEVHVARLPSQDGGDFAPIQQALEQALRDKGLKPVANASAPWVLQTQWKVRSVDAPQALSPRRPFDTDLWFGTGGSGASFMFRFPAVEPVWTALDLDVVLRERASQAVAFEAHASHQGPWNDIPQLATAVVNAAFQHYPNGKPNLHTVIEEIPK